MKKSLILTDTHFGARNDSTFFNDYFFKFFNELVFPYIKTHQIKTIYHLGDFWDRRKYINFNTLNMVRQSVIEPLGDLGVTLKVLLGNHDIFYKNTSRVNSIEEIFGDRYPFVQIYNEPTIEDDVVLCPWIIPEKMEETIKFLKSNSRKILMGHFDIFGFIKTDDIDGGCGIQIEDLAGYDCVLSGHFHTKQSKGNIHYLGSPYPMTWGEVDSQHGFHVMEYDSSVDDVVVKFIQNENVIFQKIEYDDTSESDAKRLVDSYDYPSLHEKYVKVVVVEKTNPYIFDLFIDKIMKANPADLNLVDVAVRDAVDNTVDLAKDTIQIIHESIDDLDYDDDHKEKIKSEMSSLYKEALFMEVDA